MPTQLQLRGGTTVQTANFTGLNKEVTVDTDKNTLVVHDGITAGGHPLLSTGSTGTFIDLNAPFARIKTNDETGIQLGSPNDQSYVNVANANVTIQVNSDGIAGGNAHAQFNWIFQLDGKLKLPPGGDIVDSTGSTMLSLAALGDVNVAEGAGIDGQYLKWDNATSKWIASTVTGGSGNGTSLINNGHTIALGTNGTLTLQGGATLSDVANTALTITKATGDVHIITNGQDFKFSADALFIPGSIYSTGTGTPQITSIADLEIVANNKTFVFDHTTGGIVFPDLTVQQSAYQLVAVPTHSTGTTGNKAGMLAFDSNYIYYCTADFGGTVYTIGLTTSSGMTRSYLLMYSSNTGFTSADLTGFTVTGPGGYSGAVTGPSQDMGGNLWEIPVTPSLQQQSGNYVFTGGADIWKRVALSTDTW